ncbi:MAG: SGNH/GDSL hydrolase family protein, partial [Gemmatimonadetes bacterium]|nr:SGNH/GDSL hydrolase family protein [Gemmatimonadota bacterium]
MARDSPRRLRGRFAGSGLVLLALAASLAGAEVVVRAAGLVPPAKRLSVDGRDASYVRSSNPALAYELRPNLTGEHGTLVTNSLGCRDVERSRTKPPGVRRVLLLGDSVVEGDGIPDRDDTISRQWERRFPDDGVEVLNFGVSGFCTRSAVEFLSVRGVDLNPDDAVLLFVENDFHCFSRRDLELGAHRPELVN